jgi:hypothetical protein
MLNSLSRQRNFFLSAVLAFAVSYAPTTIANATPFNHLVEEKAFLEKTYGIKNFECFPFTNDIGDHQQQVQLIANCLTGTLTLKNALAKLEKPGYQTIGISKRFLRTGGFHTILVPWDATLTEMVAFLDHPVGREERSQLFDQVAALKKQIQAKIRILQLYCALNISNDDCIKGYQNLAAAFLGKKLINKQWRKIKIVEAHKPQPDPYTLALGFNDPPETMRQRILRDVGADWELRKKTYAEIQSRFGTALKETLQLANLFCTPDLNHEECVQGAENLYKASEDSKLQEGVWGQVTLNRFNTLVVDDYNLNLRFDLAGKAIAAHLKLKPSAQETTSNTVLAEKLENRTKNNPSRLRAVCDLEGLRSELCVRGFQTFIEFISNNRDYQVGKPWGTLMFIDGSQLARVNFALNSSSRNTYLYIDADSSLAELANFLDKVAKK